MDLPAHQQEIVKPDERVYFFSDAHLDSEKDSRTLEREQRVIAFLEQLRTEADVLVILGDLFDFYFEYKTVLPARHLRVMAGIEALARSGVRCWYVAGNHDFWLGELFSRTLGVRLVPDSLLLIRETDPGSDPPVPSTVPINARAAGGRVRRYREPGRASGECPHRALFVPIAYALM